MRVTDILFAIAIDIQGVPKKSDLWKIVTEGHWVELE